MLAESKYFFSREVQGIMGTDFLLFRALDSKLDEKCEIQWLVHSDLTQIKQNSHKHY